MGGEVVEYHTCIFDNANENGDTYNVDGNTLTSDTRNTKHPVNYDVGCAVAKKTLNEILP